MLGKNMLLKLYDYNCWANSRILDCAAKVGEEAFEAPTELGRSLNELIFHTFRTEWVWRNLAQYHNIQAYAPPVQEDYPTLDQIRARWKEEQNLMRAFLAESSEEEIAGMVHVQNRDGTTSGMFVWQMLLHALLHSMQHRSEAAALVTSYGCSPGDLDFIFFTEVE
jgi:uncharacterized damage-inducible protein DinB